MRTIHAATLCLLALFAVSACDTLPVRHAHEEGDGHADGDHDDHDDAVALADPTIVAAATHVRVLSAPTLDCPAQVLGIVDVHEKVESEAAALEILRRRAAARGADAVTGVEFHHGESGAERTHLSGTAVRCNDLLHGRRYEVLEQIDVRDAMGREDAVFDALKERARRAGANLVLGVHFVHGEGPSEGVRAYGTAVRAYEPTK